MSYSLANVEGRAALVADGRWYLSRVTTLTTGDLIFTGTPDGIGVAQGKLLADGDIVTTHIDGIGTLTNRCVRGTDHHVC